jgi:hypothetical protein
MNKTLKIIGWLICVMYALGVLFKIQHYPGGAPFLVFGGFLYLFAYLPIWLIDTLKQGVWKIYVWAQYLTLTVWILATIFKTQHWFGAGLLYNSLLFCSVFLLFPVYLIYTKKRKTENNSSAQHLTFFIIIFGLNFFMYATGSVSKNFVNMITTSNTGQVENTYSTVCKKNNLLYNALDETLNEKEKLENISYQKSIQLKKYVQEIDGFIKEIKLELIARTEGVSNQKADSVKIAQINDKLNMDISGLVLCAENSPHSGYLLKQKIEKFRDSIVKFAPPEKQNFIKEGIQLNTDDIRDEEGAVFTWVSQNFEYQPLASVLQTLTSLQVEIKSAEQQVLSELFNQTLAGKADNIAAKISEYGMKYENEKKQKEIELLKKDKEYDNVLLENKNQAIAAQEQTIVFFAVGMVLVAVLIFYILRSNIQRKKANRLLSQQKEMIEQQKEIVEEKQKEIIDSIKYAKRIQTALMPSEKNIKKNISRLNKK